MNGMHSLVFAAPKSNSGKTMIVCGLIEVFKRKNYRVNVFKCGPDYIDPMFHRRVLGVEAGNLDTYFTDEETTKYLYAKKAAEADITLIEGVMGYYDGLGGQSERASTYEVAKVTKSPVVLVIDCKGASVSLAALIKGIKEYRSDSNIQAVILNRVSPMYYERLKTVIEKEGIEVVGYVPEKEELKLGSRHLGLVTPAEMEAFNKWVSDVADVIEKNIDMDRLYEISKTAGDVEGKEREIPVLKSKVRIAIARDDAFSFYYSENEELIKRMGGEIVYFSPLNDKALPENTDGIILGGGYPELYAKKLSQNREMIKAVETACKAGVPVLAECGGFMYLQKEVEDNDGKNYGMCGVLEGKAYKTNKLSRFGYIELECKKSGVLGDNGSRISAHEFHYWDCNKNGNDFTAKKPMGKLQYDCIVHSDKIAAGYPHLYFYANPDMLYSYLNTCLGYRAARLSKLHWDSVAKPIDSLGLLEDYVVKLCEIAQNPNRVDISKRAVVIMCGDHGVVSEGVTQTGSEVTKIVAENFAKGCSTINYMSKTVNADVFAVDVGIDAPEYASSEPDVNKVANRKVARGTKNLAKEAAMTREQCIKALNVGIDVVKELKERGYNILATGEMGIGNTTPTSALAAVLLGKNAEEVTGKGAGLSSEGIKKKVEVVKAAAKRVEEKNLTDVVDILAEIGGYDIAGMVGMFLGGVKYRVPIIIDGAISSVAALVANSIDQRVKNFALASHISEEATGRLALDALGLDAILHGKMCMGEGTGAVALFPILDMAAEVYNNLEYFGDFDIEPYRRFE